MVYHFKSAQKIKVCWRPKLFDLPNEHFEKSHQPNQVMLCLHSAFEHLLEWMGWIWAKTYHISRCKDRSVLDAYELQIKELLQQIQSMKILYLYLISYMKYKIICQVSLWPLLKRSFGYICFDRDDKALISQYWYKKFKQIFFGLYLKTNSNLYVLSF